MTPDSHEIITWSDEFEAGRQEVVSELEKTISRRLRFIVGLREQTKGMAYSKEKRDGIEIAYAEFIKDLAVLKTKRKDINTIA